MDMWLRKHKRCNSLSKDYVEKKSLSFKKMIEELIAVYLIHLSYFALVFMPVISSLGFPFSEELVLLGAGYLASTGFIRWDLGMLLVFIGVAPPA